MDMSWLELTAAFLLICLPLLWNFSQAFRYYCRFILYTLWVTLSSCIFVPIFLLRPKDICNMRIATLWFKKTLWVFGVKWEVRNVSKFSYDKPCVIVCNHQSIIDVMGMVEVIPPRTTALAKKELMYAGPFGLAAWLGGMIFVDRLNRDKAHQTVGHAASVMLEKNMKVWIFPEGTRYCGDRLLPFKKGAFHLAIQAQVPIFPVVFSSYRKFLNKEARVFNSGEVIITCLPRIDTVGLTTEDVTSLADRVRNSMETAFLETSREAAERPLSPSYTIRNKSLTPSPLLNSFNNGRGDEGCLTCDRDMDERNNDVNGLQATANANG